MKDWIPLNQVEFNEGVSQIHVDTRDFNCAVRMEKKEVDSNMKNLILNSKKYPHFFCTVNEIKEILYDLFQRSGGGQKWRFLMFEQQGKKIGGGWDFKYLRIYKTESGYMIGDRDAGFDSKGRFYGKDFFKSAIGLRTLNG